MNPSPLVSIYLKDLMLIQEGFMIAGMADENLIFISS